MIINKEMAGLSGKAAKSHARLLAQRFGCDLTRVYAHSKDVRPRRQSRSDAKKLRALTPEVVRTLAWYTVKQDFSAPHITEIAAANNLGEIKASTYNRALREMKIDRKTNRLDLRPYQSWEAKFPNHLHQIDSTVSGQFYIDDDDSIGYESAQQRYKNKPGNRKPRLVLLLLKDDFSRCVFAQFTTSNDTYSWMNFLYEAWKEKDDPAGFPFHGLPRLLYTDNDSVVKTKRWINALNLLNIDNPKHKPGNPRAKGKAEVAFRFLQEFEKITKIKPWPNLAAANADLFDYLYYVNNRPHSATGVAPFKRWQKVPAERLKAVPEADIFRLLHMDEVRRKIKSNLTMELDGVTWQLPWREPFMNHIGQTVTIYRYPKDLTKIFVVLNNKEYEVEHQAQAMRTVGKYDELPQPEFLQRRNEIAAQENPGLKLSGFYKERHRQLYMPRQAQDFDPAKLDGVLQPGGIMRTKLWFTMELQYRNHILTPPLASEKAWVEDIMAGAIEKPEAFFNDLLAKLDAGDLHIHQLQQAQANG